MKHGSEIVLKDVTPCSEIVLKCGGCEGLSIK